MIEIELKTIEDIDPNGYYTPSQLNNVAEYKKFFKGKTTLCNQLRTGKIQAGKIGGSKWAVKGENFIKFLLNLESLEDEK